MREVVLYQMLSLDGVAEHPGGWFPDGGPEVLANLGRIIEPQDDVLLGRGTYDYWVDYWPTSEVEPFATFINRTPKHVVTSSTPTQEWANATLVTTPVADHVTKLKQQPGGDIGIHGSIELARALLDARLVDEIHLVVAPTLVRHGKRLFDGQGPSRPTPSRPSSSSTCRAAPKAPCSSPTAAPADRSERHRRQRPLECHRSCVP